MILDLLQSTNSVIQDSISAASSKRNIDSFNKQLRNLDQSITSLVRLMDLCEAFGEKKIAFEFVPRELKEELLSNIENCQEEVSEHTLNEDAVNSFQYAGDNCRRIINDVWNEYTQKNSAPIISALDSLEDLLDDKQSAEALKNYLKSNLSFAPNTPAEIDTFLKKEAEGREIIEKMNLDADPQIKSFIDKVGANRATVEDLTPNVIKWLEDHHLKNKIRLTFRS